MMQQNKSLPAYVRDSLGIAFFVFAAILSGVATLKNPSILAALNTLHNAILAFLYATRLPARRTDRIGLVLALAVACLPMLGESSTGDIPPAWTATGIAGELLVLWSLTSLGGHFGIAPADRGLAVSGPYNFIRHPMYTGELVLRLALSAGSADAWFLMPLMLAMQTLRAFREEKIIAGYKGYADRVPWMFLPGIF
jgi:protein-S-isoprenylcysteine O-methyltransferase Ste14